MLFEISNHPKHNDLSKCPSHPQRQHMEQASRVIQVKLKQLFHLKGANGIYQGQDGFPFVCLLEHLHGRWLKLGLYLCLEVGQKPIHHH
jgi:hypothetical protein